METERIGGITLREVVVFQTQIMMGAQFGRVKNAEKEDDLMIACLRMGWNDAFRHTSENVKRDGKSLLESGEAGHRKHQKARHDDFICAEILSKDVVLEGFQAFATAKTPEARLSAVTPALKELFQQYKRADGDRPLCFGHFQKMFNIAVKLYVCLYLCRTYLDLADHLFNREILDNIINADCPIDSIILGTLGGPFKSDIWSQYGTEKCSESRYVAAQEEIQKAYPDKSRLYYDFVRWSID